GWLMTDAGESREERRIRTVRSVISLRVTQPTAMLILQTAPKGHLTGARGNAPGTRDGKDPLLRTRRPAPPPLGGGAGRRVVIGRRVSVGMSGTRGVAPGSCNVPLRGGKTRP